MDRGGFRARSRAPGGGAGGRREKKKKKKNRARRVRAEPEPSSPRTGAGRLSSSGERVRGRSARAHLVRRGGGRGFAHEGEERGVVDASLDELVPGRRRARRLDPGEEVEARAVERAQLDEAHEFRGGVVGQRARDGGVDVEDVDLEPADEVLQRLRRCRVQEEAGEKAEEALERRVQLRVGLLVLELAVRLRRRAAEERLGVRVEAPVEATQLGESCAEGSGGVGGGERYEGWEGERERGRRMRRGQPEGDGRREGGGGCGRRGPRRRGASGGGGGGTGRAGARGGGFRGRRDRPGSAPCDPTAYIVARSMSAASLSSYSSEALPLRRSSLGPADATTCSCAARDVIVARAPRPRLRSRAPRAESRSPSRAGGLRFARAVTRASVARSAPVALRRRRGRERPRRPRCRCPPPTRFFYF